MAKITWLVNNKTDFDATNLIPRACTPIPSSPLSLFLEQAKGEIEGELVAENWDLIKAL